MGLEDVFAEFEEKPAEEEKQAESQPPEQVEKEESPTEEKLPEMKEEPIEGKLVCLIYGLKGVGKTYTAFSFPGRIACLSFDKKSSPVKRYCYNNDERIKVYDAVALMNYSSPEAWTKSADETFRRLNLLIDKIAGEQPDWILIDGVEILEQICEMVMRHRNNLMPFQGIANRNLWKERRMYIRQIHNKCFDVAKRGVIYTTYVSKDEIVKEGEFVTKSDVPRWIDCIMWETDVVIKVEARQEKGGRRFYAIVESSKYPVFKTGTEADITDTGITKIIKEVRG